MVEGCLPIAGKWVPSSGDRQTEMQVGVRTRVADYYTLYSHSDRSDRDITTLLGIAVHHVILGM